MENLPEGFTEHNGGECPVAENERVICIVKTSDGARLSHASPAHKHEWRHSELEDGLGAVLAYRIASPEESLTSDTLHLKIDL
jgi:hypothetical protein